MITVFAVLFSLIAFGAKNNCPANLKFQIEPKGSLTLEKDGANSDFIFLSDTEFLAANLGTDHSKSNQLQIYRKTGDKWMLDVEASKALPRAYHPRQLLKTDIDGDRIPEVLIADHGPDVPPFPGHYPHILKNVNGKWMPDKTAEMINPEFTFNVAALPLSNGKKALYKANIPGRGPVLYSFEQGKWKNASHLLPKELLPGNLCMMTALSADLDGNGLEDLYLGGCDMRLNSPDQTHDRILSSANGKWTLEKKETLPKRYKDAQWGTVFIKAVKTDGARPDILIATHDFQFHEWKTFYYQNLSTPGKFAFKETIMPLNQEPDTEGFAYAIEEFPLKGNRWGFIAEVRGVIRDPKKHHPTQSMRMVIKNKNNFVEASACLPERISKNVHHVKAFPGNPTKLLFVPYQGEILEVTVISK